MQNQNDSLIDVMALLYKNSRLILIVSFVAAVLTAGLSLLLPNYYEASTQFYAASPEMAQPSPIGNQPEEKKIYGNDNDIDRLISISKSNNVKNFLIDSFELFRHYEIKPESKNAKHKLLLRMDKLFNTTKTKYDAIKLSVEDKDPGKASAMANATRVMVDSLAQKMIKQSQAKLLTAYKSSIEEKQKQYNDIADSLFAVRARYNIFNTQSQGEAFGMSMVELEGNIENYNARVQLLKKRDSIPPDSIAITEAKLAGYRKQYSTLKKSISSYNDGYPSILRYERDLKDFGDQLNLDKERYKQLLAAYNSEVSAIHIVEEAEVPVYKSRPKRSLLVIGAAFLAFVLTCMWVLIREDMDRKDWRKRFSHA